MICGNEECGKVVDELHGNINEGWFCEGCADNKTFANARGLLSDVYNTPAVVAKNATAHLTVGDLLQLHDKLCLQGKGIMEAKNHDYTSGSDNVFANFEGSNVFGVSTVKGILVRIGDKLKRIQSFDEQGHLKVKDESVQDALIDIINYSVLIGGVFEQEKRRGE